MASKYAIGTVADPLEARGDRGAQTRRALARAVRGTVRVSGLPSPYYDDSHRRFRADLRKFFDEEVMRGGGARRARNAPVARPLAQARRAGVLASRVQSGPWLKDVVENCGVTLPGGVEPERSTPSTSSSRTKKPPGGSASRGTPTVWARGS